MTSDYDNRNEDAGVSNEQLNRIKNIPQEVPAVHDFLIKVLTMKPNEYFDYNKNKLILNGYSKEELVELCLISCRALEKK